MALRSKMLVSWSLKVAKYTHRGDSKGTSRRPGGSVLGRWGHCNIYFAVVHSRNSYFAHNPVQIIYLQFW